MLRNTAFDEDEGLSEHSAPFDAMVQVIDGADVSEKAFEKQDYLGKDCK